MWFHPYLVPTQLCLLLHPLSIMKMLVTYRAPVIFFVIERACNAYLVATRFRIKRAHKQTIRPTVILHFWLKIFVSLHTYVPILGLMYLAPKCVQKIWFSPPVNIQCPMFLFLHRLSIRWYKYISACSISFVTLYVVVEFRICFSSCLYRNFVLKVWWPGTQFQGWFAKL